MPQGHKYLTLEYCLQNVFLSCGRRHEKDQRYIHLLRIQVTKIFFLNKKIKTKPKTIKYH